MCIIISTTVVSILKYIPKDEMKARKTQRTKTTWTAFDVVAIRDQVGFGLYTVDCFLFHLLIIGAFRAEVHCNGVSFPSNCPGHIITVHTFVLEFNISNEMTLLEKKCHLVTVKTRI